MEKAKITFLGTSNAVPTKKRNHTSILLTYKDENILIDCGEGTQRQFKIAGLSAYKLDKILISHWHGDHILGLPGLFQTLKMDNYNKTLGVYGPKHTKYFVELMKKLYAIKINLDVNEVLGRFYNSKDFYLESMEMKHGIPSLAYSFVIKDKLRIDKGKLKKLKLPNSPLVGKLQQGKDIVLNGKKIKSKDVTYLEKGKKITFIFDTLMNDNAIRISKDSDILVCESSFSKEDKELAKEHLHLTTEEAATIAKKSGAKKLILTHISQRYEHDPLPLLREARKIFRNSVLANDFDIIEI